MAGIFDYLNSTVQSPMFLAGAGLLSGEGFGGAMQGMQAGQRAQAIQRQQMQEDQRRQAFEGLFADPKALQGIPMGAVNIARAAGPESGLPMLAGMMPKPKDPLDERYRMAQIRQLERGPDPLDALYKQAQIDKLRAEIDQGRGGKVGLVPIYGRDENDNPVVLQPSPTGELVRSKVPEGVRVDLGLKSAESAYGREIGESQAKAQVDLPKAKLASSRLTRMIDDVASDPYLDKMTGLNGWLPNVSSSANRVQSRLDQIGGATFLQAFEALKGGGAITEIEGSKATDSLNRLRNTKQGTPEYRAALAEFRQDVVDLAQLSEKKASAGYGRRKGSMAPDSNEGWTDIGGVRIREKR